MLFQTGLECSAGFTDVYAISIFEWNFAYCPSLLVRINFVFYFWHQAFQCFVCFFVDFYIFVDKNERQD